MVVFTTVGAVSTKVTISLTVFTFQARMAIDNLLNYVIVGVVVAQVVVVVAVVVVGCFLSDC